MTSHSHSHDIPDAYAVLVVARDILSDKGRWVKHRSGVVQPSGETAHCALGAVEAAAAELDPNMIYRLPAGYLPARVYLERAVQSMTGRQNVVAFNDGVFRRHSSVLKAFDKAIALAKVEHDERLIHQLDRLFELTTS